MDDDDLLLLIYASVTSDGELTPLLQRLAARFGCDSCVLVYTDPVRPGAAFITAIGPFNDRAVQQRYYQSFAKLDPAPAAMTRLNINEAASTDQLFAGSTDEYRPFLDDFYHPIGLAAALGGPLVRQDGRTGIIAIHRRPDRAPFTADDATMLQRLMPHLGQMLDLRGTFFAFTRAARALAQAVEVCPAGIMVFDHDRVLTHANSRSRDILARGDGLGLDRSGRLTATDPATRRRLQALLAAASQKGTSGVIRVQRSEPRSPYVLRVWRHGDPGSVPATDFGSTIYMSDPDRPLDADAHALAEAFGLKPSSAALVAALLNGDSLTDHARRAGRSQNTMKFHLRSAFAATKTNRQADLLRHCVAIVRDLGL